MSNLTRELNNSNMFQYEPLDTARGHIRLLKLSFDLCEGDIQCSLHIVEVSDKPRYRALSYEWGPEAPLRRIRIGGSSLSIRDNLWQFLMMFIRVQEDAGFLWIDQICINQDDHHERSCQVQQMGTIYRNAVQVIVWLGHPDNQYSVANCICHDWTCSVCCGDSDCKLRHADACCQTCRIGKPEFWKSYDFHDIVMKSYWSRLWIVQEIRLARSLIFYHGRKSLDADEILSRVVSMTGFHCVYPREEYIETLLCRDFDVTTHLTLADLLYDYNPASLQCTDPRDLIYGLLGLVQELDQISVDYAWSNEQVFDAFLQKLVVSPELSSCEVEQEDHRLSENLCLLQIALDVARDRPVGLSEFKGRSNDDYKSEAFIAYTILLEDLGLVKARWTIPQLARIASTASSYDDGEFSCLGDGTNEDVINEIRKLVDLMNSIEVTELEKSLQDEMRQHRARRSGDSRSGLSTGILISEEPGEQVSDIPKDE